MADFTVNYQPRNGSTQSRSDIDLTTAGNLFQRLGINGTIQLESGNVDYSMCTVKMPLKELYQLVSDAETLRLLSAPEKEYLRITQVPHEFRIRIDSEDGGHVHFTIFSGKQGYTGGNCGRLCMNREEFEIFTKRLSYQYEDGTTYRPVVRAIQIENKGLEL